MSALDSLQFNGYKMRPAEKDSADFALAQRWSENDPFHQGILTADFWVEQGPRRDSFVFEDKSGPLLFFKMHGHGPDPWRSETVEVFVQFSTRRARSAAEAKFELRRLQNAMREGFFWVERLLRQNGVTEVFFDSRNESLIRFCTKELGFSRHDNRLSKALTPERED